MQYIIHRRFRETAICGPVNLPSLTICDEQDGFIMYNGKRLCAVRSENAHNYFARNDDGMGMLRGKLTRKINNMLNRNDSLHQKRWDIVWSDTICDKYRRHEHVSHWIWNQWFFDADIEDLQYVLTLIDVKQ